MEIFAEQFIPSDRSHKSSQVMKKISIVLFILSLFIILLSLMIAISVMLLSVVLFLASMCMYVDYEYEFFDGTLTVTKIFNMSKRKITLKVDKGSIKNLYALEAKKDNNSKIKKFYTTNIEGLKKYNFELNNGKIVQLALNTEIEKLVNVFLKNNM
ncbi:MULTISPECIES: hypothetical protein [unclassified Clostridium]|uniref:hypothetical protein n=1 Tax=unclassified Clostridium TaxID=2614128 RepID=UPI00207A2C36|nr:MULTISPECIES: hypothetical protein [unclassified Clostridium]